MPIVGVLLAAFLISGSTCLASGLRFSRGEGTPSVDRRFLVSFGLRGLLSSLSAVDVLRPDQVVLALFLSPAALGLYVVGLAFTNLPYFVAKSVGLITFPWVASRPEKGDARRTMWSLFWLTTGIALVLVAGLCASAHWLVPFFFGSEFSDAVTVTYIVLPGTVFLSARRVLSEGLKGRGYPLAGTLGELALAGLGRDRACRVRSPLGDQWRGGRSRQLLRRQPAVARWRSPARHGELESAGRSLLSLPRDLIRTVRGSGVPPRSPSRKPTAQPASPRWSPLASPCSHRVLDAAVDRAPRRDAGRTRQGRARRSSRETSTTSSPS